MAIIEIKNLIHCFAGSPVRVVDGISFAINEGEIFGLLGPNGAGKSTIINILVTLLRSNAGFVSINGIDLNCDPSQIRKDLGIVFQDSSLDERLTAYENLYFHAKLYHVPARELKDRINSALQLVNLTEHQSGIVMKFSGGMKRRLEIARGIVHQPKVLFLDEPTIGLDPQTRRQIWDYIVKLRKEKGLTVFLTTHYMEEAEICDRIAIIDHGKIITLDTPANLKKQVGGDIITLWTENKEAVRRIIEEGLKVEVYLDHDELQIQVANGATFLPLLFTTLGTKILAVNIKTPTLEDVFIKLTGREIRETEGNAAERLKEVVKIRRLR